MGREIAELIKVLVSALLVAANRCMSDQNRRGAPSLVFVLIRSKKQRIPRGNEGVL
jgi:hypothetical protein